MTTNTNDTPSLSSRRVPLCDGPALARVRLIEGDTSLFERGFALDPIFDGAVDDEAQNIDDGI